MSTLNISDTHPNIGTYLAELLEAVGLEHYFTVLGDYNLVLLDCTKELLKWGSRVAAANSRPHQTGWE